MRPMDLRGLASSTKADMPLSDAELAALQHACAPVGLLSFPPIEIIRKLRQHGYVEIVLGGVQITPLGLERLLLERQRRQDRAGDGATSASSATGSRSP